MHPGSRLPNSLALTGARRDMRRRNGVIDRDVLNNQGVSADAIVIDTYEG